MDRASRHWIGALAVELAPAAFFNFAAAFAVATLLRQAGFVDYAAPASVAAGIAAFLLAWQFLRRAGRVERSFPLPSFEYLPVDIVAEEEGIELEELLLTESIAAPAEVQRTEEELLLDDIVESIGPDSRVVRLFDPRTMPTAGELQARIDRHLRTGNAPPAPPIDATRELHDAIAALRQSLR
jgi:hypothetical protein